jgi:GxxExxY protein
MSTEMQGISKEYIDELSYKIIGCAIEVHKQIGPGLIESVYQKCFERELSIKSLQFETQLWVPLIYKGRDLDVSLRADVLVEDLILVELKAIEGILPVHHAQVLTYMKLMQKPKGILINFNCTNIFREGQKTLMNELYIALPDV